MDGYQPELTARQCTTCQRSPSTWGMCRNPFLKVRYLRPSTRYSPYIVPFLFTQLSLPLCIDFPEMLFVNNVKCRLSSLNPDDPSKDQPDVLQYHVCLDAPLHYNRATCWIPSEQIFTRSSWKVCQYFNNHPRIDRPSAGPISARHQNSGLCFGADWSLWCIYLS